jgi:hypothetical protein
MISIHGTDPSLATTLGIRIGSSPAAIVPRTRRTMGLDSEAFAANVELTAYPSIAELSNGGVAIGLQISCTAILFKHSLIDNLSTAEFRAVAVSLPLRITAARASVYDISIIEDTQR